LVAPLPNSSSREQQQRDERRDRCDDGEEAQPVERLAARRRPQLQQRVEERRVYQVGRDEAPQSRPVVARGVDAEQLVEPEARPRQLPQTRRDVEADEQYWKEE
jgi:hypothetical protein